MSYILHLLSFDSVLITSCIWLWYTALSSQTIPGSFSLFALQKEGHRATELPDSITGLPDTSLWLFLKWCKRKKNQSVQFSLSVVSNSLRPHEPQHVRPPCPSPTPGVYSNPCPLNWWCHPTISSSAVPFSSCPQSFPASGSFPMSQFFASGGQSIGVSASASVREKTYGWY